MFPGSGRGRIRPEDSRGVVLGYSGFLFEGKKRMHTVVMESLEEYLAGALEPAAQRKIEAHLNTCRSCREEMESMREVSQLFGSLRSDEVFETAPGFCTRVLAQVNERKAAVPAFASLFGLDFAFARRLIFASLLTLAA